MIFLLILYLLMKGIYVNELHSTALLEISFNEYKWAFTLNIQLHNIAANRDFYDV